jgi:Ni/Fe-hydrogenase 1 B-type cytochrome subunit
MEGTGVQRVLIWSGMLRLSHWLMALSVLVLLATGGLLGSIAEFHDALLDYHYLAGYALIAALLCRAYLLFFGHGAASMTDLIPRRDQLGAMTDMLRFYLSFARWPLPSWYAHNPLWRPIYLLLLVLLVLQALSGLFADAPYLIAGESVSGYHNLGATLIGFISGLHVLAVFLHDLKGTGSDVSAMINGHRIFVIKLIPRQIEAGVQRVSLDQIGKAGRRHKQP